MSTVDSIFSIVIFHICMLLFEATLLSFCKPESYICMYDLGLQKPSHTYISVSGKASALDMPRTWVRLLASVKFFIYSVASILQCSPCEVLEGPISTRVGII